MKYKQELTIVAVVLFCFMLRPPIGYDTYAFMSGEFHSMNTPLLSEIFFSAVEGAPQEWYSALGWFQTMIYLSEMAFFGINPLTVLSLPYLFTYSFRIEDDQLAYIFIVPALLLARKGRKVASTVLLLISTMFWKGSLLLTPLVVLSWIIRSNKILFLIGMCAGALFVDPLVAEQNPLFSVFFLPILYITARSGKVDPVTAVNTGVSILYPKWFYVTLPLLYAYVDGWLKQQPQLLRRSFALAGTLTTVLICILSFPQPWIQARELCVNNPQMWSIGRWCEYHSIDVDYKGWPPRELREGYADNLVRLLFGVEIPLYEIAERIYNLPLGQL